MATLGELVRRGELVSIGGGLESYELQNGVLCALPRVIWWLDKVLPELEPVLDEGRQSPLEQVDDLFHDFVAGEDISFYQRSHSMIPTAPGVWELKTPDVRFFGWFVRPRHFIIAAADSAERCKLYDLYAGYRGEVVRLRDALDLDPPKFVTGGYSDVL